MQQPQPETIDHSRSAPLHKLSSDFLNISILVLAGAIILFINIGGWDLWNPDEPRYAQVAREMMQTGNYLVPHINSEIYPDKPPVFFWLIALASKPFGDVTSASARIPSAVAALGVILLTYLFGRILYNQTVGLLAGLILLTTTQFTWLALRANIDITLTLWTTLSIFLFYSGYTKEKSKTAWYLLSYGAMGLAVLTKGPVGFAIPLITIALFLIAQMQFKQFKELSIGKGVLIIAGVTAVWLVPACILGGGEYAREIIFKQTISRTVDSFSHKQPFYYYLINFPADFNPWTFFIPSAVIYGWRKIRQGETMNLRFPLVWFLGTFVFFSFISGKRNLYLMPLYPAAALLMARFWYDFTAKGSEAAMKEHPRLLTIPFYLLFGGLTIFSIIAGAAVLFGGSIPQLQEFDLDLKTVPLYPLLIVLCAGGVAGLLLIRKRVRAALPFSVIILVMFLGFIFSVRDIFPSLNAAKSAKPFCDRINKIVKPEDKLIAFRFDPESFNYFLNRTPIPVINDYEKMKERLKAPDKVYGLVLARHLDQAPEDEKKMITVLDESQIGHRKYYFFVNHAAGSQ
jgi:4-amino-4-deoxy-L-arabinose transferase-like glycosyltransferase